MLNLNEKDDQKRAEWMEKHVNVIDMYIGEPYLDKPMGDPTAKLLYKIHYTYDNQNHTIVCDHSSIRDAVDRAMEVTEGGTT
jgi:hypothetical protein